MHGKKKLRMLTWSWSDCEVLGTKRTAKVEEWARAVGAPASRRTDTHSSRFIHTARSLAVSCTFFMRYGGSLACTHEFTAQIHPSAPETRQHIARERDLVEELPSRCELIIIGSTRVAATTAAPLHSTRCGRSRSQSWRLRAHSNSMAHHRATGIAEKNSVVRQYVRR
jgi:hypothetical protein